MCISILRGDSLLRCKYSDLFVLKHSDFTEPASIFDLTYFVNVSDESKTNHVSANALFSFFVHGVFIVWFT